MHDCLNFATEFPLKRLFCDDVFEINLSIVCGRRKQILDDGVFGDSFDVGYARIQWLVPCF